MFLRVMNNDLEVVRDVAPFPVKGLLLQSPVIYGLEDAINRRDHYEAEETAIRMMETYRHLHKQLGIMSNGVFIVNN